MLAPTLRRNVLIRSNRPSFLRGAYVEKIHNRQSDDSKSYTCVSLPVFRGYPPATGWSPYLIAKNEWKKQEKYEIDYVVEIQ